MSASEKFEEWQERNRTHTCERCGSVERCAKKYTHVCGRCGYRWRTGYSSRDLKEMDREALILQEGKLDPWSSSR